MFQLTLDPKIIRRASDGASIPTDEGNADYQEFLRWRDGWVETQPDGSEIEHAGHMPLPPDPPAAPSADQVNEAQALQYNRLKLLARSTQVELEAYIDQIFPGMSAAQREFVKTLAKGVQIYLRREFKGQLG